MSTSDPVTENRQRFNAAREKLGLGPAALAEQMQVSPKTVETWLYERRRDVPTLAVLLIEAWAELRNRPPSRLDAITQLLRSGESCASIARKHNLSRERIRQISIELGIGGNSRPKRAHRHTESDHALVIEGYRAGATAKQMSEQHGFSTSWIYQVLRSAKITMRGKNGSRIDAAKATKLLSEGMNLTGVAYHCGVTERSVFAFIKRQKSIVPPT